MPIFCPDGQFGSLEIGGATHTGEIKTHRFTHGHIESIDELYLIAQEQGLDVNKILSIEWIAPDHEKGESIWKLIYI